MRSTAAILSTVLLFGCATAPLEQGMGPARPLRPPIGQLVDQPQRFADQYVVVSGWLEATAYRFDGGHWGFDLLDEDGTGIRCYERDYRRGSPFPVRHLLRRAGHDAGSIEVAGWVDSGGRLELDWIEYAGTRVDTDPIRRPIVPGFAVHF